MVSATERMDLRKSVLSEGNQTEKATCHVTPFTRSRHRGQCEDTAVGA
jgi:hypothetical protein